MHLPPAPQLLNGPQKMQAILIPGQELHPWAAPPILLILPMQLYSWYLKQRDISQGKAWSSTAAGPLLAPRLTKSLQQIISLLLKSFQNYWLSYKARFLLLALPG